MHRSRSVLLVAVFVGSFAHAACTNYYDQFYLPLTELGAGGSGGGTTSSTGTQPECIPNQTSNPIALGCGTFVDAGANPGGDGSPDKPYATLSQALAAAKGGRVYACANESKPLAEAIEVDGDAIVFGGLDCTTWTYAPGAKTKWTAAPDLLPLRLSDGATVALTDMAIEATDATKDGGSSIAILAQAGASLELLRCDVTAGNGKDGLTPLAPSGTGTAGTAGDNGADGCDNDQGEFGGKGGELTCGGASVTGGSGGNGTTSDFGGAGNAGFPFGDLGKGGTPQFFDGMSTTDCTPGGDGAEGLLGDPGPSATGKPSISSTGYQGEDGSNGATAGKPGQGGGGGGGAKKCGTNAGPSAAGGGSGGCGGAVGKGGQAGGASIAIVSLGAQLLLSDVKLTAKSGGKGGDGGLGQAGGDGGTGGTPGMGDSNSVACAGGKGGKGRRRRPGRRRPRRRLHRNRAHRRTP